MRKSVMPRESLAPSARLRHSATLHFLEVGNIKDQKNFKDKAVFSTAAHNLLSYLEDNGYPQQITFKNLEQPTTAMVAHIFKFLMAKISPNYEMVKRIEEEFPQAMADLHYPFTLKKSHVQSATSPSGWPVVFGALHWLYEALSNSPEEALANREGDAWKEYHDKLYDAFIYQRPVAPEAVEEMRRVLADDAKEKRSRSLQLQSQADALEVQISRLEAVDNELTTLQVQINEENQEIVQLRGAIEESRALFNELDKNSEEVAARCTAAERDWNDTAQKMEQLRDAVSRQCLDKQIILETRETVRQLNLDIGDAEQDIEHLHMLSAEISRDVENAKLPVDESFTRFRTLAHQMLSQLSRVNIRMKPNDLGMSLPSNPSEQFQCFKFKIKPSASEMQEELSNDCVAAKQKIRDGDAQLSKILGTLDHVQREVKFLEGQRKRLLEEERIRNEREEQFFYERRSQAEAKAAQRREQIAEFDAQNSDLRHRIAAADKENENELAVLQDRCRNYDQSLKHLTVLSNDSHKGVIENLLRVLAAVKENQQRERQQLNKAVEVVNSNPYLKKCLAEALNRRFDEC